MYFARSGSPGSRTASAYCPGSARMWIGMVRDAIRVIVEPTQDQVLEFCAREPVERVFLEDVARRALGRFVAVPGTTGELRALCHVGANLVPSGDGCDAFADAAANGQS